MLSELLQNSIVTGSCAVIRDLQITASPGRAQEPVHAAPVSLTF